jgi:hypothetical protein
VASVSKAQALFWLSTAVLVFTPLLGVSPHGFFDGPRGG